MYPIGPLWPGVIVPVKVSSMNQIHLFKIILIWLGRALKKSTTTQKMKIWTFKEHDFLISRNKMNQSDYQFYINSKMKFYSLYTKYKYISLLNSIQTLKWAQIDKQNLKETKFTCHWQKFYENKTWSDTSPCLFTCTSRYPVRSSSCFLICLFYFILFSAFIFFDHLCFYNICTFFSHFERLKFDILNKWLIVSLHIVSQTFVLAPFSVNFFKYVFFFVCGWGVGSNQYW